MRLRNPTRKYINNIKLRLKHVKIYSIHVFNIVFTRKYIPKRTVCFIGQCFK